MNESYFSTMDTVTVAVALDDHSEGLARIGARIASRLGRKLCLLHAVEPAASLHVAKLLGPTSSLLSALASAATERRAHALAALEALALTIGEPHARLLVATGRPKEILAQEALEINSCLLVLGVGSDLGRKLPRAFSTVLSLMASTPLPLLAIDPVAHPDFPRASPRIAVADDLGEQTEAATQMAALLATLLGGAWLHHVHVNALTRPVIAAGILAAGTAAHTQLPPSTSVADIHGILRAELDRAMERRIDPFLGALAASGGRYTREIAEGPTRAELDAALKTVSPDLVVFGRHSSPHGDRLSLARISTRAMLAAEAAVMIVPDL